jgi:hypothetical protein
MLSSRASAQRDEEPASNAFRRAKKLWSTAASATEAFLLALVSALLGDTYTISREISNDAREAGTAYAIPLPHSINDSQYLASQFPNSYH